MDLDKIVTDLKERPPSEWTQAQPGVSGSPPSAYRIALDDGCTAELTKETSTRMGFFIRKQYMLRIYVDGQFAAEEERNDLKQLYERIVNMSA